MAWLRWHEGTVNDPKFMVVSRKSGQPVGFVLAVWAMLLERASSADERGNIGGFDCESADAVMGMPDGAACAIVQAMQDKELISEDFVCRWAERQPLRERSDEAPSTERVRKHRERQKENGNTNLENETPCNAMKHHETPRGEEIRGEENKDKKTNTLSATAPPIAAQAHSDLPVKIQGKKKTISGKRAESFLRWWEAFGDKRGKAEAVDAWADIPELTDSLVEKIIAAAGRYAGERPTMLAQGRTPKMAQGWIAGRRWEDEPDSAARASPSSQTPPSNPVQDAAKAEAVQKAMQRVQDEAQRRAMEFLEKGRTA